MNKLKAIKILEEQKEKIIKDVNKRNKQWTFNTASYIKDFFGENSVEYNYITKFNWSVDYISINDSKPNWVSIEMKNKPIQVCEFLDNCKSTLKNKGLYKEPKKNLLSDVNNWQIITIIVAIFIAGLSSGIWLNDKKSFSFTSFIKKDTDDNSKSKSEITESKQKKPVNNNHITKQE